MARNKTIVEYEQIKPKEFINSMAMLYAKEEFRNTLPAVMLWGAPGVGKSQSVEQFAKVLEEKTKKKVNCFIVSLLLMSPIDLRGIPAKDTDENGKLIARWLPPEVFNMDASDNVINILFLDEISSAPLSVQASAYQICLNKRVGEHKFPENTIVICAGNRVTDKAVAYKMPKPLANRMTHFEMVCDVDEWCAWAIANDIDSRIVAYIKWRGESSLNSFNPENDDVAFATPRAWESVDKYLKSIASEEAEYARTQNGENPLNLIRRFIVGRVGKGEATTFMNFTEISEKLPKFEDILSGKISSMPEKKTNDASLMYALSTMIVSNIIRYSNKIDCKSKESIKQVEVLSNVWKFVGNISREEYQTFIVKAIFEQVSMEIINLFSRETHFQTLFSKMGQTINDLYN